jgi:hypothetical protein
MTTSEAYVEWARAELHSKDAERAQVYATLALVQTLKELFTPDDPKPEQLPIIRSAHD